MLQTTGLGLSNFGCITFSSGVVMFFFGWLGFCSLVVMLCVPPFFSNLVHINQGNQRAHHNRSHRKLRPHSSYGTGVQLTSRSSNFRDYETIQHRNSCLQNMPFWYFALSYHLNYRGLLCLKFPEFMTCTRE